VEWGRVFQGRDFQGGGLVGFFSGCMSASILGSQQKGQDKYTERRR